MHGLQVPPPRYRPADAAIEPHTIFGLILREVVEDLLERRALGRVLLDGEVVAHILEIPEQVADALAVVFVDLEVDGVAGLLDEGRCTELFCKPVDSGADLVDVEDLDHKQLDVDRLLGFDLRVKADRRPSSVSSALAKESSACSQAVNICVASLNVSRRSMFWLSG